MKLPKGYLSPTQVNAWRDCPRCYEYAYVKEIPKPSSIHFAIGTFVHSAVEEVARAIIAGKPIDAEGAVSVGELSFDQKLEEPLDEDGVEMALVDLAKYDSIDEARRDAYRIAEYTVKHMSGLLPERGVIATEFHLGDFPADMLKTAFPFPVNGRIDLLYGDPDTGEPNCLTDLKTSSKSGGPDENGVLQFCFYALPAWLYAGAQWRVGADIAVKTRTPDLQTYWANGNGYLSEDNYKAAHEIIMAVANHISVGDFPVGKGWNGRHDYEHGLPPFTIATPRMEV